MKNIKSKLRKEIIEKRDQLSEEIRKSKDQAILERLMHHPSFVDAKNIFVYIGFGSEINTSSWFDYFYEQGKNIFVPYVDTDKNTSTKTMRITPLTNPSLELEAGFYGILEVKKEFLNFADPNCLDLILMPGVAFDEDRNRVGYGGGFYDRFLEQLEKEIPLIALAYEEQIVSSVPVDIHDQLVDEIITDQRTI